MRLSRRVLELAESATLAVTAKAKALRASGVDVIGFGAGEPDFDTPEPIRRAAIDGLQSGQTRYVATAGDPAARAAIARKLELENGISCRAEDVVVTVGAKHAIYLTLQCLLDPPRGDEPAAEVVIPTPAWVSYRPLVELAGGRAVEVPSTLEQDFKLAPEALEAAIGPRTAAIILNSPSNPCGTVYTPAEIRALAAVLERHPQVVVISDEIYEKLIYPEVAPGLSCLSPGSLPALATRTVTINGLSKAYAMTGWRIGYAACPAGSGLAGQMAKLQGQMTNNITSFVFPAIVEALEHGADAVETMRKAFAARAVLVQKGLETVPGVESVQPTGAFYAFPRIRGCFGKTSPKGRRIDSAMDFAEALLDEAAVAVVPGEDFGPPGAEHVRISFACGEPAIEAGLARIRDFAAALR